MIPCPTNHEAGVLSFRHAKMEARREELCRSMVGWYLRSLGFGVFGCLMMLDMAKASPAVRLQFDIMEGGKPVEISPSGITRMDFLISEISLKPVGGDWVTGEDWFAWISAGEPRLTANTEGSPAGEFERMRFRVGLKPEIDKGDTAQWPPGHALHPDVNHMHWGWRSGYVHMAIEGWRNGSAFSYHLAGDDESMWVEMPVKFRGGGPVTLKIEVDLGLILEGRDPAREANATHSREGDGMAVELKRKARGAFRVTGVTYDLFQVPEVTADAVAPLPPGTKAYQMEVTQRFPQITLPADNPLTEQGVALGRRLFSDPILSVNESLSCASCHHESAAFSDPRRVSLGALGQSGTRHSMPLFNLAWAHEGLFWDGRAKNLREQVLMPITDPNEMGETLENVMGKIRNDDAYLSEFAGAFGEEGVTEQTLAKALEQFLITRISQDSKFDRAVRKQAELTEQEKLGLSLFVTEHDPSRGLRGADCFHCHGGTLFTDNRFHNNGLTLEEWDIGRMKVSGDPADRGKFKTPSLRNIDLTAPYMHDGRFATLEEVVEHYNSGVERAETLDPNLAKHPSGGLGLSEEEKAALVAFLKTLTDSTFNEESNNNNQAASSPPQPAP